MKKIIGGVLVALAALNFIGFIYLSSVNPEKISKNSSYFGRKIITSLIVGGIGIYFLSGNNIKNSDKTN